MHKNVPKYLALSCSFFFAGNLNAEDKTPDEQKNAPVPCCASACHDTDRYYLQVEGLYWKTTEDNTSFAEKETASVVTNAGRTAQTIVETEKRQELDFEWQPGARVTLGFMFPTKQWDVDLVWTHLLTHASKTATAPDLSVAEGKGALSASGTTLSPSWLSSSEADEPTTVDLGNVNSLDADWHLYFNNVDLTLGQTICASPCFNLRVFGGPKYTRIIQKYEFSYVRGTDPNGALSGPGTASQTIKTHFNGFGLQGGLQADWVLGSGFSIYSGFGAGMAYGYVTVRDKQITHTIASDSLETFDETETVKDNIWATRPNIDFALGLEWNRCFSKRYLLGLNVGWEFHNYFDQNFFRMATEDDPARGDLAFQGFTFGASFAF